MKYKEGVFKPFVDSTLKNKNFKLEKELSYKQTMIDKMTNDMVVSLDKQSAISQEIIDLKLEINKLQNINIEATSK